MCICAKKNLQNANQKIGAHTSPTYNPQKQWAGQARNFMKPPSIELLSLRTVQRQYIPATGSYSKPAESSPSPLYFRSKSVL